MPNKYKKPVIAIDGPTASGKTSLAQHVAGELNALYFTWGTLYRMLAYELLTEESGAASLPKIDEQVAEKLAKEMTLEKYRHYIRQAEAGVIDLNTEALANLATSLFFTVPRESLLRLQQEVIDSPHGLVIEGRDVANVTAPDADVKIFITASPEARAQRRAAQFAQKGKAVDVKEIQAAMLARDEKNRAIPGITTGKERDVVTLDTTQLSLDETHDKIMALIRQKIPDLQKHR